MTDNYRDSIEQLLLPAVQTPGQYIGGEFNEIKKDGPIDVSVALAFPDTYALGMSHLGLGILYEALNQMDKVSAQRVYCPWLDAEKIMRENNIPLFAWETRDRIKDFDLLGITLQHELAYTNVLYLLDLADITFRSVDRKEDEPIVIGGGPMADSCEPVAEFFDMIILGDGEEALPAVVEAFRKLKATGTSRKDILLSIAKQFDFVYVPQFYHFEYNPDGTIKQMQVDHDLPRCIKRAAVMDLENAVFPTKPLVANTETPHDRIAIEVMRGCPGRCAFCHAGYTKGKLRWRSVDKICDIAWESFLNTGHDTVSLLSLSTSDYPNLKELVPKIYGKFAGCHVGVSLPSLRVDKQLKDVPATITGTRREGLTIAVEAASARMRKAIGKRVTDDDLMATLEEAYKSGWKKVKLYFMIGFPGETEEDIDGIIELGCEISRLGKKVFGSAATVSIAISWLVPKAHTPFAWIPQQTVDYFMAARYQLFRKQESNRRGVCLNLKLHHTDGSRLEGVFARGDRKLSAVLERVYQLGAKFDSWRECFDVQLYNQAFEDCGIDPDFYSCRQRPQEEILPWDHLAGDNKEALYRRYEKIMEMLDSE